MRPSILRLLCAVSAAMLACLAAGTARADPAIVNPAIDMQAYLRVANAAAAQRESHRVSEDDFIRMSHEPGTVILDARSARKYAMLHVRGAINVSFPDFTIDGLRAAIPDPSTRILIYCNNNFSWPLDPFPAKLPSAALNLSTYIALYDYGYRDVWELGPLIDARTSRLDFEGERIPDAVARALEDRAR